MYNDEISLHNINTSFQFLDALRLQLNLVLPQFLLVDSSQSLPFLLFPLFYILDLINESIPLFC